jgi:tRNA nucleotidyltransferase (CCA-adding enzyme)
MIARLPADLQAILAALVAHAEPQAAVWLVGGVVRDLLLGVTLGHDVDLAIEGDVAALAPHLSAALGGELLATHPPFGTATLQIAGYTFDLARTRREVYAHPAALPTVTPAPLQVDLQRRDFSINAMAIRLHAAEQQVRAGSFVDPYAGRADLAANCLRLLHAQSLRDDPTRMLRGVRLAARLDLTPEPSTAAQIAEALAAGYLALLSPERVLSEVCLALDEERPAATLACSDAWGVTPQILPGLHATPAIHARFARYAAAPEHADLPPESQRWLRAALCLGDLPDPSAPLQRYVMPVPLARLLRKLPAVWALIPQLAQPHSPGALDALLHPFSISELRVLHYASPKHAEVIDYYVNHLRPQRPPLDGRDLQRLGIAPGPQIKQMLTALRRAYLDGEITTLAQAEDWVRERVMG